MSCVAFLFFCRSLLELGFLFESFPFGDKQNTMSEAFSIRQLRVRHIVFTFLHIRRVEKVSWMNLF